MKKYENKKFGFFLSFISTLLFIYYIWNKDPKISLTFLFLAVSFILIALLTPNLLAPLNKIWFGFGLLLGKFFNPLILAAIFFVILSPISLILRIFNRDSLLIKKRVVDSYWLDKPPLDPESFKNQF